MKLLITLFTIFVNIQQISTNVVRIPVLRTVPTHQVPTSVLVGEDMSSQWTA